MPGILRLTAFFWVSIISLSQSPCPGDVNGDGMVSEEDVAAVIDAWNLAEGDLGFSSLMDVDQSGRVDVLDLVIVLSGQGTLCGPSLAGCAVFPMDNIWNTRIDALPVHANSDAYIASIGASTGFHMDFGSGLWNDAPIGIPYCTVDGDQPLVPISFMYADESDPGPYPVPSDAPIEGGPNSDGDRHVLVLDQDNCILYELYDAWPQNGGSSWNAGSGAVYDLASHALRPDGWTSADAAGLPILPGLVRYDEMVSGAIGHAIRFTAPQTQRAYVWPARHFASSSTNPDLPPMGIRLRLKADYDISGFSSFMQVLLTAMKEYGIILADNGSAWYVSGVPDERWNNDELHTLDVLQGSDFEVVDVSGLMIDPDSGQAASSDP